MHSNYVHADILLRNQKVLLLSYVVHIWVMHFTESDYNSRTNKKNKTNYKMHSKQQYNNYLEFLAVSDCRDGYE